MKSRTWITQIVLFVSLALLAFIFLLPFYFITINSVKSFSEIMKSPASLPEKLQLKNYEIAIRQVSFFRMLFNSLVISIRKCRRHDCAGITCRLEIGSRPLKNQRLWSSPSTLLQWYIPIPICHDSLGQGSQ